MLNMIFKSFFNIFFEDNGSSYDPMQILWVYPFLGTCLYTLLQILLKSGQALLSFQIDINKGTFTNVAGVPPDYFNADGQFWGNPLYQWDVHRKDDFLWWRDRLSHQLELFDVVRIDHFRGFHDYWSIPDTTKDAKLGEWKNGPGMDFWEVIQKYFPDMPFLLKILA